MVHQLIYKDIKVENEGSYGASIAAAHRLHVKSCTLNLDRNKEHVEDTNSFVRGRDRIVGRRDTIEGDITGFGSPRSLHHAFEWVNGSLGTSVAAGVSGAVVTYPQNTSGTFISKNVNVDRNNSQDMFLGVVATSMELTCSDNLLEYSLSCIAKERADGAAITSGIGETVEPFNIADFTITIHQGASYGAEGVTLAASEWNVKYDNGVEGTHFSGDKGIQRVDPKIPTIEGKISVFHKGASWARAARGCNEFYIRFEGKLPSCGGLINGITQHLLRVDIPRAEITTSVRNYEQAEFAVEELSFKGMIDISPLGTSSLWVPSLTMGMTL